MTKQPPLASKEASLFRQVLKNYETKQYKKGLRCAEQILKKNQKHGETLAMKGLILNCLGRQEEAFTIAKEALTLDMKSHVCWHVYGLLWRSVKNYDEAIKAYKQALKIEPDSQQILRDLAYLQVQTRDFMGYAESRRTILQGRPNIRANWTGLAIAYHLAGDLAGAENILTKFEGTLKKPPPKGTADYVEHSEAALYKNTIIAESENFERALEHLESISKIVLDKLSVLESKAKYLLQLKRWEEAEKSYLALLNRNSDNREYYSALEQCWAKGANIQGTERSQFKTNYEELAEKYPKADSPKRVPLDFLEGDEFKAAADTYIRSLLQRGVPSTFANIKALYRDPTKREVIPQIVHKLLETKEAEKTQATGDAPESIKWVLYFLAQHYDHYRTRDSKKALEFINRAIDTSPTVEVQMTLARIHKHTGDLQKAMEIMNKARETDLKDRFINTKCAKYQLRNNCSDEALQTMSLFTRNEANGGPLGDLLEMQCVWYLTEDAESYSRQKRFGLALKRYHSIWKIFDDWTEDQFDFHSFSLRKGQIRAYIEMIRWEHTLRSHPFFARAALGAIKAYIQLADRPHLAHGSLVNGVNGAVDFDSLNTADRKKALKKAKREAQKQQEKEAAQRAAKKDEKKTTGDEGAKKEDDDPRGEKLAQTTNPLGDAMKFLTPLLELSPQRLEVQLQGFEVYIRKEKYLLALKCLLAAAKIAPENPSVHGQIIRFKKAIDSRKEPLPVDVTTVINTAFYPTLLPSKDSDLVAFNNTYLAKHKDTPSELFGALRAKHFLDPASTSEIETIVLKDIKACLKSYTLDDVYDGLTLLGDIKASDKGIGEFKLTARGRWENASRLS